MDSSANVLKQFSVPPAPLPHLFLRRLLLLLRRHRSVHRWNPPPLLLQTPPRVSRSGDFLSPTHPYPTNHIPTPNPTTKPYPYPTRKRMMLQLRRHSPMPAWRSSSMSRSSNSAPGRMRVASEPSNCLSVPSSRIHAPPLTVTYARRR